MKAKSSGLISIIYGLVGCGFGVFALLTLYAAQKMIGSFKSTGDEIVRMKSYFLALGNVWMTYMPLMIIIGLIYVLTGWLIKKEKKEGVRVGIFAAILNLLWCTGYATSLISNVIPTSPSRVEPAVQIFVIAIVSMVMCLYPLYFLFTFRNIELKKN